MIEKGQVYEMTIEDMSSEGQGIGRIEGMTVFAAGAVIGDLASVEITKLKKSYAFGWVKEILKPSADRKEALCRHAGKCGGCSLQELSYEAQLQWKRKLVADKLVRIGGIENPKVHEIVGMDDPWRYRNKAQFPVGAGSIGFYRVKSHDIVNCEQCLIQTEPAERITQALRDFMKSDHISAYDENTGKGLIRHLIVRTAFQTGEVMVILVINGKGIPNGEKLIYMMDDAVNELAANPVTGLEYSLESVVLNINKKKTSEIMGEECITFAGKPTIMDRIGGLEFEISPLSFYQLNPAQTEKLYQKAVDYAGLTGEETVFDLYCGVGTIGLFCASKAKKVIGVESVKPAVLDANRNAVINGIVNAEFVCGKAEEEMPKLMEKGMIPNVVILDPPRAGCDPALLEAVAAAKPERIVYVSCDPATLARDVKILCEKGFRFVEAQPVDMFPWSGHVEMVVKLERR